MRTLGKNMAFLIKSINLGKENTQSTIDAAIKTAKENRIKETAVR